MHAAHERGPIKISDDNIIMREHLSVAEGHVTSENDGKSHDNAVFGERPITCKNFPHLIF